MGEGIQRIIIHANQLVLSVTSSKNKTLLTFCFLFIFGASLFSWVVSTSFIKISLFALLFICLTVIIFSRKKVQARFLLLGGLFFLFGAWWAVVVAPNCHNPGNVCFYNDRLVELSGTILGEPDRRIDKTNYRVTVNTLSAQPIIGRVLVSAKNYPEYNYGDELKFKCRLQAPENKEGSTFRYDKYLGKEDVWSLCTPSVISSVARNISRDSSSASSLTRNDRLTAAEFLMKYILIFKKKLDTQVNALWPQPESGLMAGILYGSKNGLPPDFLENFSNTGVTHIIAVSGFNITIIATVLMSTLIAVGLWRRQAFWVALVCLWLFTALSGLSASVVRAAIMGTLVLVAVRLGRKNEIGTALVFTAAVMLVINPYLLVWDAGFQLSFLATVGLVYISPILERVIASAAKQSLSFSEPTKGIASLIALARNDSVKKVVNVIGESFITTLSAIIITLPLIMYQFGRLSLVAPLVNILILWIVPWLMLVGFVAIVASVIFFPLGQLIAYIANFGLDYVIKITQIFGERSWSSLNLALPWWGMVALYILLCYLLAKHGKSGDSTQPVIATSRLSERGSNPID